MKTFSHIFCLLFSFAFTIVATAQDSTAERKVNINGYLKNMQTLTFDKGFKNLVSGNLLHNRINLKWKPAETVTIAVEVRNRFFWGEEVKATPNFAKLLKNEREAVNLSTTWISNNNIVLHSNVERFYAEYHKKKWNLRAGRQRINWGVTTLWNPDDLFNTYNFLDFDYEERPGSDAVKAQYLFSANTNMEMAVAAVGSGKSIGAMKFFTNKWNYDFQAIGGWYYKQLTVGVGWAGSIKEAGFKGELMYFVPNSDSAGQLNATMEWDYMFVKGWYINVGGLFNAKGLNHSIADWKQLDFKLSPKNLWPGMWCAGLTIAKELNPLLSIKTTWVFSPKANVLILIPGLTYNLAANVDADLLWQSFFAEERNRFEDVAHKGYLRIKWNF